MTSKEIAELKGWSTVYVSRVHTKALDKMMKVEIFWKTLCELYPDLRRGDGVSKVRQ